MRTRRTVLLVALLAAAACGGGGSGGGPTGVTQASGACDDAFAGAAIAPTPGAGGTGGAYAVDPAGRNLLALEPTLTDCQSFDDWMAGARAHLDAMPSNMDPESALVDLCQSTESKGAPCDELVVGSEGPK